jgi:hypothetical protein
MIWMTTSRSRARGTICIVLVSLLIAELGTNIVAQSTQTTASDPCATKVGCVTTEYDKFQDRTYVMMSNFALTRGSMAFWNTLSMRVAYFSPGTTIRRPEKVGFIFTSTYMDVHLGDQPAFAKTQGVYLLIDDKPYPLGDASLNKYEGGEMRTWVYVLEVPFNILELIASGKSVEMRAGAVEFTFDDELKASFRRLVELAPKEEIKKSTSTEKQVAAPNPKPTQPARPSRRRKRP